MILQLLFPSELNEWILSCMVIVTNNLNGERKQNSTWHLIWINISSIQGISRKIQYSTMLTSTNLYVSWICNDKGTSFKIDRNTDVLSGYFQYHNIMNETILKWCNETTTRIPYVWITKHTRVVLTLHCIVYHTKARLKI